MQSIGNRPCFFISDGVSFVRRQIFSFSLDLIQLTDVFQGLGRKFTLIRLMQVVELAAAWARQPISVMPLPKPAL